jgi:hypothetical protein
VYTQHRIQLLLSRFQEIKKDEPDRADDDIKQELVQWALDNRDNICSAFLMIKGEISSLQYCPPSPGFDPTKDTPVEILRTILLGVHYVEAPHSQTLTMHTELGLRLTTRVVRHSRQRLPTHTERGLWHLIMLCLRLTMSAYFVLPLPTLHSHS